MHEFVHHNGRLLSLSEARLSPGQSGLFNGWGIFTTLLIHRSVAFAQDRHWQRLSRDATLTHLSLPVGPAEVDRALHEVVAANSVVDGLARVYIVKNRVGIWQRCDDMPPLDFMVATADLPTYPDSVTLAARTDGRHAAHPLAGAKVISWLPNVWMLYEAHQRGFHETLLLNERAEVAECTAANVFCVRDDRVETPPLESGCLAGVTRAILIELADELGLDLRERPMQLGELLAADEVFITSTSRGVLPVRRIEDHRIPVVMGPAVARLAEAFRRHLEAACQLGQRGVARGGGEGRTGPGSEPS